jgi:serine-type D-Ala-D-Ala carboxypeptidase/endopeptidase (penicillin-binding protein 4)
MFRIISILFILSLFAGDMGIQRKPSVSKATGTLNDRISSAIKTLENDKAMSGAQWGFCAYNITKKTFIAEKNTTLRLIPASVLKIFTTISAFEINGHQSSFETLFMYRGKINEQGVLTGDIVIRGNGDPTIACEYFGNSVSSVAVFSAFRQSLEKAGIKEVNGNIIGDASLWGAMLQAPGYMWEDLGNYYGAGTSSLNYAENKLKISFKPGKATGDSASVLNITPHPIQPVWINNVTTASATSGDNVYIYGAPFQKVRYLTGTVPSGKNEFSVWASDPDPALRFAGELRNYLSSVGISVNGQILSEYRKGWNGKDSLILLTKHISPTFGQISKLVNQKSHNVCAESLFRYSGMTLSGASDYAEAAKALMIFWHKKGIQTDNQIITDGSGLSRTNMITTAFLVDMLVYASSQPWFSEFFNTLPVAGKDGTLRSAFSGTSAENNFRGKSGFLKSVRSYTGYLNNKSGDLIAFAVIVNGHILSGTEIRKKLENLIASLSDSI